MIRNFSKLMLVFSFIMIFFTHVVLAFDIGKPFGGYVGFYNVIANHYQLDGSTVPPWWGDHFDEPISAHDVLVSINDHPYDGLIAQDIYNTAYQNGNYVKLGFRSNGTDNVITQYINPVIFSRSHFVDLAFPSLLYGFSFWLIAIVVYDSKNHHLIVIIMATYAISFGTNRTTIYLLSTPENFLSAMADIVSFVVLPSFLGVLLFLFAHYFPTSLSVGNMRSSKFLGSILLITSILISAVYLISRLMLWNSGWSLLASQLDKFGWYGTNYFYIAGAITAYMRLFYTGYIEKLTNTYKLQRTYLLGNIAYQVRDFLGIRHSTSLREKRIAKHIFHGLTIPAIVLITSGLERVFGLQLSWRVNVLYTQIDIKYFGLIAGLMICYVILEYELFQKKPKLLFAMAILFTCVLLASLFYPLVFFSSFDIGIQQLFLITGFVVCGIVVFSMTTSRGIFAKFLHKKRIQVQLNYKFIESLLPYSQSLEDLAQAIPRELQRTFNTDFSALWLYEVSEQVSYLQQNSSLSAPKVLRIPQEEFSHTQSVSLLFRTSSSKWFAELLDTTCNVIAILKKEGQILGYWGIGIPADQYSFDLNEDSIILKTIAEQTSILLANAKYLKEDKVFRNSLTMTLHDRRSNNYHLISETLRDSLRYVSIDQNNTNAKNIRRLIQQALRRSEEGLEQDKRIMSRINQRDEFAFISINEFGLIEIIKDHIETAELGNLIVRFDHNLEGSLLLPFKFQYELVDKIIEALNNIEKHAKKDLTSGENKITMQIIATVTIMLVEPNDINSVKNKLSDPDMRKTTLLIEITDDGEQVVQNKTSAGKGLIGMQMFAEMYGGEFTFKEPSENSGMQLKFQIPLPQLPGS